MLVTEHVGEEGAIGEVGRTRGVSVIFPKERGDGARVLIEREVGRRESGVGEVMRSESQDLDAWV